MIRRAITAERPPHALLLLGPDGIGKTTLAMDLAAGLLCVDPDPAARPCRRCAACRKVEHGNHPDLHLVAPDGAGGQIRLAAVQELAAELALLPLESRFRVAVIEDAHRLNPDAQNALLKTLEEPGAATCIVLVADDEGTLLPTVLSRAARLRMGPVARPVLSAFVAEQAGLDAATAASIAAMAEGRPGLALRLAADPDASLVRARLARRLLDLASADRRERLASVAELMADGASLDGPGRALPAKPQPADRRRAALGVIDAWRQVARDLAVARRTGGPGIRQVDLLEDLAARAPTVDEADLLRFLDRLDGLAAAIEAYASPELVLDSLVLTWPRARRAA